MNNSLTKLIKTYRELGLSKTEALFLLEILASGGQYKESESTYLYNASTIKKIRASLYQKALISWTTKPLFADTLYIYDTTNLEKKLEYIEENKTSKANDLFRYIKALGESL
jgi:hypothetical protein